MRIPQLLLTAILLFNISQSVFAQWQQDGYTSYVDGHVAAKDLNSGSFVQLWRDNAIIWKYGSVSQGLRFGSATDFGATGWTERMRLLDNGNLGIGTASPASPLSVLTTNTNTFANIASFKNEATTNTWMYVANRNGQANLGVGGARPDAYLWSSTGKFFIGDEGSPTLFIDGMANGNVSIGTPDSKGYKLAVAGDAIFTKVVVKPYPFPDYVFHANYRLRPLSEVEQYIKQYGHLPEVPTAEEVKKNGLDVGDNQITLLKKIEELTLYVIEQNKKIQALDAEVKSMKGKRK
jgi:hypothetical protein